MGKSTVFKQIVSEYGVPVVSRSVIRPGEAARCSKPSWEGAQLHDFAGYRGARFTASGSVTAVHTGHVALRQSHANRQSSQKRCSQAVCTGLSRTP